MLNGSGVINSLCPVAELSVVLLDPALDASALCRSRWRTRPGTEFSRILYISSSSVLRVDC
jgi:hypothetical protein